MDIRYQHPTVVHAVRACLNDDARELVAVAGEHTVDVIQMGASACTVVASFHIGNRITALAWSSRTVSPSSSDNWILELAAASSDFGLHLLTKAADAAENVFPFGGGLSGHHGTVNDISFCGGSGDDSARYVATVSDDRMMMVWDLHPSLDIGTHSPAPDAGTPPSRPQPTAYVINFAHPLTSICAHPTTNKEFLVADSQGSIFLTDWRTDPLESGRELWRHSSVIELVEPRAMADTAGFSDASVSWRRGNAELVGATFGSSFAVYDLANLHGGKPTVTGTAFPDGGHKFRWCHTDDYFAISARSPTKGAVIHLYNTQYVHTQPNLLSIAPRPQKVRDFDFLALPGIPRIAAAVGKEVIIFPIGVE